MCETITYFEVIKDYQPPKSSTKSKYLTIRVGDVVGVDLSLNQNLSAKDWMVGRKRGTNEIGLFPKDRVRRHKENIQRPSNFSKTSNTNSSIESASWYWGDISNKEGSEIMLNTADGSFLVRNSSDKDEYAPYTLMLRVNRQTMLVHIYHSRGKYDFAEPLEFSSVKDLIGHYSENSMKTFNCNLDLKLGFPISRPASKESKDTNVVQLRREFISTCIRCRELERDLTALVEEEEQFIEERNVKRTTIKKHEALRLMYTEHMACSSRFKFFSEVSKMAAASSKIIKKRLSKVDNVLKCIRHDLVEVERCLQDVKIKSDNKISEMVECNQEKEMKENMLIECGETLLNIALIKKGHEIVSKETVPHLNESLWLLRDCDRARAECLLANRPKGTFLIRKREGDSYAMSIVSENHKGAKFIAHCEIDKKDSGYGFAEPFFIYKDLCDLVLHYKDASLFEHNDDLDVKMEFPVFSL